LVDRRLYLPQHWAADPARRRGARVPPTVAFQTKTQLAPEMLAHSWALGVRGGWVTGDEVYGRDGSFRRWLTQQEQPSVLAVPSSERIWVIEGTARRAGTAAEVAAGLAAAVWQRRSCGDGAKGPRWYDWAWLPVAGLVKAGWGHWLLVRRSLSDPTDLAYYLVAGPATTTLETAVGVAGARWGIEQALEEAKGEAGLDEYEVRCWRAWHRHITLSMLAHACLVWIRSRYPAMAGPAGGGDRSRRRTDRPDGAGDAPLAGADPRAAASRGTLPSALVAVAARPPGAGQALPLPATRPPGRSCSATHW
jgi:SRSO17 transposase